MSSVRFGIRWYEGFGDHDFVEASRATYATLRELVDALSSTAPEADVFRALTDGPQDSIYWVRDDLGFDLFTVYLCAHCGEPIEPTGGHDWVGPVPEPGELPKRYHLSTDFPECRRASGACGGAS